MDTVSAQILTLEKQFYRTAGAKEEAITALGLTPMRYYQLLNRLLDDRGALVADPQLVYRLRRIRTRARRV